MNIKRLETELEKLGKVRIDLDRLIAEAELLKSKAAARKDEKTANKLWLFEAILTAHRFYVKAFDLLKRKQYVNGWNLLERAEIEISSIKKHIHLVKSNYQIKFIENMVSRFQILFPYRLFMSSELLEKEITCSICDQKVTIRQPCGHRIGELYMGELCFRNVTKCEVLGIALVETPVNKYSVVFNENEDEEFRDKEQFGTLNYLLALIKSPYDQWRVEISEKFFPHSDHPNAKSTDPCPCDSGYEYLKCCLPGPGIKGFDYQFKVSDNALARAAAKKKN